MFSFIIFKIFSLIQPVKTLFFEEILTKEKPYIGLEIYGNCKQVDLLNDTFAHVKGPRGTNKEYIYYTVFTLLKIRQINPNNIKSDYLLRINNPKNDKRLCRNRFSFSLGTLTVFSVEKNLIDSNANQDNLVFEKNEDFIDFIEKNKEEIDLDVFNLDIKAFITLPRNYKNSYSNISQDAILSIYAEDRNSKYCKKFKKVRRFYRIKETSGNLIEVQNIDRKNNKYLLKLELPTEIYQGLRVIKESREGVSYEKYELKTNKSSDFSQVFNKIIKEINFDTELRNNIQHKHYLYNKDYRHFFYFSERVDSLSENDIELNTNLMKGSVLNCSMTENLSFIFPNQSIKVSFFTFRSSMVEKFWKDFIDERFKNKRSYFIQEAMKSKYGFRYFGEHQIDYDVIIKTNFSIVDYLKFIYNKIDMKKEYELIFYEKNSNKKYGDKIYSIEIESKKSVESKYEGDKIKGLCYKMIEFPKIIPSLKNKKNIEEIKKTMEPYIVEDKIQEVFGFLLPDSEETYYKDGKKEKNKVEIEEYNHKIQCVDE